MIQPGQRESGRSQRVAPACSTSLFRVAVVTFLLLIGACSPVEIVRVRAGQPFRERTIDSRAYAAYVRARLSESKGETAAAAAQYQYVLLLDPLSVDALIRLGTLYCASSPAKSSVFWEKAERIDSESPKLWFERARCEFARDESEPALRDAKRAMQLDPLAQDAVCLAVDISTKLGRPDDGLRWLRGALALNPANGRLWQLMFQNAGVSQSEKMHAVVRLWQLRHPSASEVPRAFESGPMPTAADAQAKATMLALLLDEALQDSNLPVARETATLLGMNPEQLALSATAAGSHEIALDQAELLLALDHDDAVLWAVGLLATDALHDETRFSSLLSHPPKRPLQGSRSLTGHILDLLRRRVVFDLDQPTGDTATEPSSQRAMSQRAQLSAQ